MMIVFVSLSLSPSLLLLLLGGSDGEMSEGDWMTSLSAVGWRGGGSCFSRFFLRLWWWSDLSRFRSDLSERLCLLWWWLSILLLSPLLSSPEFWLEFLAGGGWVSIALPSVNNFDSDDFFLTTTALSTLLRGDFDRVFIALPGDTITSGAEDVVVGAELLEVEVVVGLEESSEGRWE